MGTDHRRPNTYGHELNYRLPAAIFSISDEFKIGNGLKYRGMIMKIKALIILSLFSVELEVTCFAGL